MTVGDMERAREVLQRISDQLLIPHLVQVLGQDPCDMSEVGVRCGGTGFLVNSGRERFLVTADHVVGGILDRGLIRVAIGNQSGNRGKNISNWEIIDRDENVDIATLKVPSDFDPSELSKSFFTPYRWPAPRAERGESALFGGFQGTERKGEQGLLTTPSGIISDFVVASSDRHFVIADEYGERIRQGEPRSAGGMSGAPVFVARAPHPEWVGVLYSGLDTAGQFFVSHADFVLSSGHIDKGRIAWPRARQQLEE